MLVLIFQYRLIFGLMIFAVFLSSLILFFHFFFRWPFQMKVWGFVSLTGQFSVVSIYLMSSVFFLFQLWFVSVFISICWFLVFTSIYLYFDQLIWWCCVLFTIFNCSIGACLVYFGIVLSLLHEFCIPHVYSVDFFYLRFSGRFSILFDLLFGDS